MGKSPKKGNRKGRLAREPSAGSERIPPAPVGKSDVYLLEKRLLRLSEAASEAESELVDHCAYPDADAQASAGNFANYLGIRRHDLRKVQRGLRDIGLSSLGNIETDALGSLRRISAALSSLRGGKARRPREEQDRRSGDDILSDRASESLGPKPAGRSARVMVTMPTEAAHNYELVRDLVAAGAGIVRITSAHDGPAEWARMIEHARKAEKDLDRRCLVMADLAGPKLRTGPIDEGLAVASWRPFRNGLGEVLKPARVWLSTSAPAPETANAALQVDEAFLAGLRTADVVEFQDARGRKRSLTISEAGKDGAWAEATKRAFVTEGARLVARRGEQDIATGVVGPIGSAPRRISLSVGDVLVLTRGEVPRKAAVYDEAGELPSPSHIGCTLPEVFRDARAGQPIFFDDGKIAGVMEKVRAKEIDVRVTWTRGAKAWLSEHKGINVPDTDLRVSSLTRKDKEDLKFFLREPQCVDIIGMSFVRSAKDVQSFFATLKDLGAERTAALVKIENSAAFQHLPEIILQILKRPRVGVMIARGDLGVEVGFERLAELQEEILSLCTAAHLPVVWATQVLETLAKKGLPSRAEVSDAVMAARTQCVMLNKGPYVRTAVSFLVDVLERMEGHQAGQLRLLRKLSVAGRPG